MRALREDVGLHVQCRNPEKPNILPCTTIQEVKNLQKCSAETKLHIVIIAHYMLKGAS